MSTEESAQRAPREGRLNLRASSRQETLLRHAAAATDRSVTDFVLDSAVTQAERVLADRRWFVLDDERWQEFERLLEVPVHETPKLTKLFGKPSPFSGSDGGS
ncbi:type II toxin-antitoxin system TacA family antitoxin [Amycolatopsis sp. CB00013]|uniref:type II toxin-antitoxin system TacA family antitoxin n=1 Tax=Amycolatopsis sp. CB00013 TaxID=1703945 RepID=UPI00093C4A0A|nr:DUF1778 domain-containing protein [Amycolatopsis sp. CB00013]OKJ95674.1 hypothetical protein AMK34_21980 [Amycolatopsis sp. CB00013]